ncbi:ammonium transporter [Aldersonia sp. NBC_00410]|uniref:ammonium transporter n=1 Tax=Aldersonia sp. NBC_00410 TaxID=2975954 RepID=UPI0022548D13|nr:ammonium transporter [Aldersonia sp. NBC_00410]MCX5042032.1 ammonium transporter [Aldersonia sp. NBC_00410]
MRLIRTTTLAVMTVAALSVGAGTANAHPVPVPIGYETMLVDRTVVTTLDGGFFQVQGDGKTVDIKDLAGNTVVNLPLAVHVNGVLFPLNQVVKDNGKILELTPNGMPELGRSLVRPVASPEENTRAQQNFQSQLGIATAIGSLVGLGVGVVAGAVIGCILGSPFFGLGCLPAAAVGATLGGILGTLAVGGPTAIIAGVDLIQTLTAPPGTTKWNYPEPPPAPAR